MYDIINSKTKQLVETTDKPWPEVQAWLMENQGHYAKKHKADLKPGIYCDAGQQGVGNTTRVRVCDKDSKDLIQEYIVESKLSTYNGFKVYANNKITNNTGEALGLLWAIKIAIKLGINYVYTDSKVAFSWLYNGTSNSKLEKITYEAIKHLHSMLPHVVDNSLIISTISGDVNPADLGNHK